MNKSALRSFSAWARRYLISNICDRAQFIGVTKDNVVPMQAKNADSFMVNGVTFEFAPTSRDHFVDYVREIGWENAIEEIAYTWFNRILAIRFMEVNGYLENGVNGENIYVIGSVDPDRNFPDAVDRATELKYVDKEKVYKYQDAEDNAGLFRYILMSQCAELSKWMPDVFEKVSDYTDLLLPETLLFPDGLIEHLTHDLNAADFDISAEGNGQVEIFGWMYQFYIAEKKDEVFKSDKQIDKGSLPAATQLFTPDWIVRYMVENSLGKIWVDSHPQSSIKTTLKYFSCEDVNDEKTKELYETIKKDYQDKSIREIRFIDPCCGSGHILVYAFDLFYRMYLEEGYTADMIPSIILENNLYGLDIDKRAIQLTSFALTMKARSYNKRLFNDGYHFPNVMNVHESNSLTDNDLDVISKLLSLSHEEKEVLKECVFRFKNAEFYGSLINNFEYPSEVYGSLLNKISEKEGKVDFGDIFESGVFQKYYGLVCFLVKQAMYMSDHYDCVVTNPPYLNPSACGDEMKNYATTFYPDSKTDLFAMFIERASEYVCSSGLQAMITMHSWMFLSSYEKLRKKLLKDRQVLSMLHLGARAFEDISGEVVQTTSFVIYPKRIGSYKGEYYRLTDYSSQTSKEEAYLNKSDRYVAAQEVFAKIPGTPWGYWLSDKFYKTYDNKLVGDYADCNNGFTTGNNALFLREWFEVDYSKISLNCSDPSDAEEKGGKWFPYNKGGNFRKWYGNNDYVINWEKDGRDIKAYGHLVPRSMKYQFRASVSWSKVSTGVCAFRYKPVGTMFDVAGLSMFPFKKEDALYLLALCNSRYAQKCLEVLSPTMNFETGHIAAIPAIISDEKRNEIEALAQTCVDIARADWDFVETSWDYKKCPYVMSGYKLISEAIKRVIELKEADSSCLKNNERRINELFNEIFGVSDEIDNEVIEKESAVRMYSDVEAVKQIISYAVGCIMGRYCLHEEGIVFAGGNWDEGRYADDFRPCEYGVLPITEEQYFEDDLCTRVIDFIRVAFGEESLNENLKFIAATLKPDLFDAPKKIIRDYLFNDFFADHFQMYQHRPIYWQLDSGKAGGFRAIAYMHRITENTLPIVRTEFIQDLRYKYEEEIQRQKSRAESLSTTAEKNAVKKEISTLDKQIVECVAYDDLLNHATASIQRYEIDLDDGVKTNYSKFLSIDGDSKNNILTVIKL